MPSLLQISDDLLALDAMLDETGGELTPTVEAAIDAWWAELSDARDAKLDGYAALIRSKILTSQARYDEAARMEKLADADHELANRLKARLKFFMERHGTTRIETKRYRITLAGNGGKLPVELLVRPEDLPLHYQRVVVTADLDALRDDIGKGVNAEGFASLGERGKHVRIA